MNDIWRKWFRDATNSIRHQLQEKCQPYHHWPIIVKRQTWMIPISRIYSKNFKPSNDNSP